MDKNIKKQFQIELSDIVGDLRVEGGYYGSYNGHWGVGLRAYGRKQLIGYAPRKLVTARKDLFHIGRLIWFVPGSMYFRFYPLGFSSSRKKFINLETGAFLSPDDVFGSMGMIIANDLAGLRNSPPYVESLDMITLNAVSLFPGDAFAVPYTAMVVNMRKEPIVGRPFIINSEGKFITAESYDEAYLGFYWHLEGKVIWMLFAPNFGNH